MRVNLRPGAWAACLFAAASWLEKVFGRKDAMTSAEGAWCRGENADPWSEAWVFVDELS